MSLLLFMIFSTCQRPLCHFVLVSIFAGDGCLSASRFSFCMTHIMRPYDVTTCRRTMCIMRTDSAITITLFLQGQKTKKYMP